VRKMLTEKILIIGDQTLENTTVEDAIEYYEKYGMGIVVTDGKYIQFEKEKR